MTTRKTTQQAAAERIIKNSIRRNKSKPALHGAWEGRDGQYITDGARGVRLKQKLDLPVLWTVHVGKIQYFNLDQYIDPVVKETRQDLPLPTKKALKAMIAEAKRKAREEGESRPQIRYDFGTGLPWVDAQFLVDMLDILPGCKASVPANNPKLTAAIYFESADGDGVLLPIMPNHPDKK